MIDSLQADFGIPGAVTITHGTNGMPKVLLTHRAGSRAEVYLHGAHVTSWTNADRDELFFVSSESHFAPKTPIRGGIPLIFPQFGGSGPLTQHGFARISEWQLAGTSVLDTGGVVATLQLSESAKTLAVWPHRFALMLSVLLEEGALTVTMLAANTGERPFDFQAALHTYFGVADTRRTAVQGLEGTTFVDSLRDNIRETETRPEIRFAEETDRVYLKAPDLIRLDDEGNGRSIIIEKQDMPDVVVWNPWSAKSQRMPDFGDDEYLHMACIETGIISPPPELSPGDEWRGVTRFSCQGL